MFTGKRLSTTIFLIVFFLILLLVIYFYSRSFYKHRFELREAIPVSTVLFTEFNSISSLKKNLDKNNIWKELLNLSVMSEFDRQLQKLDSVLSSSIKGNTLLDHLPACISIHPKNEGIDLLFILNLDRKINQSFINQFLRDAFGNTFTSLKGTAGGVKTQKLIFNQYQHSFSFAISGGLFIGSTNEELLKESLLQLKSSNSISKNSSFQKVSATAGKKVDANIYVNFKQLPKFIGLLSNVEQRSSIEKLANTADWSELDLLIKTDELLFNGYTTALDSLPTYLNVLLTQEAQLFEMAGILPYNTGLLSHLSVENFESFYAEKLNFLQKTNGFEEYKTRIKELNSALKTDIELSFIPMIGSELAFLSIRANSSSDSYAIIKTKSIPAARQYLAQLSKFAPGSGFVKSYKNFTLSKINYKNILFSVFGDIFKRMPDFNYTFIGNYLIVANSINSLENIIRIYTSGKTLDLNPEYVSFLDNIAESSNYYLYFNMRNGINLLSEYLNPTLYNYILDNTIIFKKLYAVGLQLSVINDQAFTNIYLKYNTSDVVENNAVWQARLDNIISGKVALLHTHLNNTLNVLAFDIDNNAYLFDYNGSRLWKYKIDGPVLSEIYEIDFYKNNKIQYLFNTKNRLYLIDVTGKNVANYPITLSTPATNGISVFDYSGNLNYRVIYAGADKKIYNLNIYGDKVSGWTQAQTLNIVSDKIQHLIANSRDHILLSDDQGKIRIINRQGKDRILLRTEFKKAKNSDFYTNKTNSKGLFLTTDNAGQLSYIDSRGNISTTDFGSYATNHYFFYEDIDADGAKDFIYLDNGKLIVFDRLKNPIFSHTFSTSNLVPEIYIGERGAFILSIFSTETNEIYLFDKSGLMNLSSTIKGSTPASLGSINNKGEINLLIGNGSTLFNYVIR